MIDVVDGDVVVRNGTDVVVVVVGTVLIWKFSYNTMKREKKDYVHYIS